MINKFYYWLLLLVVVSIVTTQKLNPADISVSNYKEHGVDGQVLIYDGRTRLFIPPKFPELPKEEREKKARDLSLYSEWKDLYCKVNFFESDLPITTARFSTRNWCHFERTDGRWEDLCCDKNHCECDPITGWGCKYHPYGKPPQSTIDLEPTGILDPLGNGRLH